MFFEQYPRFHETHKTGGSHGRLDLRYEAIIDENRDVFPDAHVVDIASHDGRWSFAALKAGAAKVVGIETQDELVRAARENLEHYDVEADRYRFVGDIYFSPGRPSTRTLSSALAFSTTHFATASSCTSSAA